MTHFVMFESTPVVNGQISAIYDNCKSRRRASGILCKCQPRAPRTISNDRRSEVRYFEQSIASRSEGEKADN